MKLNQSDLGNYYLGKKRAAFFETAAFSDTSDIHKYFSSDKKSDEYKDKYEALNAIIDCFADLRAFAEEAERKEGNIHINNPKKEIPLDYDLAIKYFKSGNENSEPPLRLICRIAEENFNVIDRLSKGLHRVLRRERDFVPVSKVQQIDVQCIRWLSRQPGRTTYERAGNRQKLLSIVRYESIDTLENRVFKQFLKLCIISCDSYIHDYSEIDEFKDSQRIKAVRRLRNLASYTLNLPEIKNITNLNYIPQPNYVLQNNAFYRVIWNLYLDLLHRTRLIENLWANRDVVICELVKMLFLLKVHDESDAGESPIKHEFWIKQFSDTEGSFFADTNWFYMDFDENYKTTYLANDSYNFCKYKVTTTNPINSNVKQFRIAYLPEVESSFDYKYQETFTCLLFTEGELDKNIKQVKKVKLSKNIIRDISEFLDGFIKGGQQW